MLFGIIDLGIGLVIFAAVLATAALILDLTDHSSTSASRPWWWRWLASGRW